MACSEDANPTFYHLAFANSLTKKFNKIKILSDPNRSILQAFGLPSGGKTGRGLFLIDPKGLLQHATFSSVPIDVSETLETLKLLADKGKGNNVCKRRNLEHVWFQEQTLGRVPADRRQDQEDQKDGEDGLFESSLTLLKSVDEMYSLWIPVFTHPIWPFLISEFGKWFNWISELIEEFVLMELTRK